MQQNFRVTKLILFPTGTYDQMFFRPLTTGLDMQTIARFEEATSGGKNMSVEAISGIAGNIIRPKAQHEGLVNIPNGWNERRLRFMLEVEHAPNMGQKTLQILTGYTDHPGVTDNGAVDPSMNLYFNSSTELTSFELNTSSGRRIGTRVVGSEQFVKPQWEPNAFMSESVGYTMRPEDLFSTMESSTLEGAEVFDMRTAAPHGIKVSRRNNLIAPQYVSRVMNAYRGAVQNDEMASTSEELYHGAMGNVRERELSSSAFMFHLGKTTSLRENGCLTFGQLEAMDPELHYKTQYIQPNHAQLSALPRAGQFEHWGGNTIETQAAAMLAGSVPALLTELLMMKITFMTTNETLDGQFETKVLGLDAFNNALDMTPYVESFIRRLEIEIMRDLTRNNQMTTMLEMSINLLGDTTIKISLGGQPAVEYVTPTFCDALNTPILTNSKGTLNEVSQDFETLLSHAAGVNLDSLFQRQDNVPSIYQGYDHSNLDMGQDDSPHEPFNPAFGFTQDDDGEGYI